MNVPIPTTINGHAVVAFIADQASEGEGPQSSGHALCRIDVDGVFSEYVVWEASWSEPYQRWDAFNGAYFLPDLNATYRADAYRRALADLGRRSIPQTSTEQLLITTSDGRQLFVRQAHNGVRVMERPSLGGAWGPPFSPAKDSLDEARTYHLGEY